MNKPIICGIDFGTSNSAVAIANPNAPAAPPVTLAPVEFTAPEPGAGATPHLTIPSTIFIAADSSALFGRQAIASYVARTPGRFMRSLKRVLGTSLMQEGTSFGHKRLSFHDVLTRFVANLKLRAEQAADAPITHVLAGRPVHFVDASDKADAEAEAQLRAVFTAAGFQHVAFQYEPLAAAFAHEARLPTDPTAREYLAFVIDIGGGTSDFAVVKLSGRYLAPSAKKRDRRKDILSSAGIRVGGNDFDRILSLASVMPLLGKGTSHGAKTLPFPAAPFHDLSEWSRIQHMYTRGYRQRLQALLVEAHEPALASRLLTVVDEELGHAVMASVEETKIYLSDHHEATTDLAFIEEHLQAITDRTLFEDKISDKLGNLHSSIAECLTKASVPASKIDLVVLTGGATSMPSIQKIARETFKNAEISEGERLASVALGLAYSALHQQASPKSNPTAPTPKHRKPTEILSPAPEPASQGGD